MAERFGHAALNPPHMGQCSAVILFCFSVLLPGVTQIIFGLFYGCDWAYVGVGILMFISSPFLIGWFWSIAWGARAIWSQDIATRQAALAPAEGAEVTA